MGVISCIDAINFASRPTGKKLVVDGCITNKTGPYTVKLSYTAPYAPNTASVTALAITDNCSAGGKRRRKCVTPATFKGETGRTYQLHIISHENRQYTFTPVTLLPVAPIDSLFIRPALQKAT